MELYDLAFYSGDEELLDCLLKDFYNKRQSGPCKSIDCNIAVEISLLLEEHAYAVKLMNQYIACGLSKFLQFRVLQTIQDEKAYDILASCFDSDKRVVSALDILFNDSSEPIYVYELGGLGDVIEGFMTIRTLLIHKFMNNRVVYLTTEKMARFLNCYLATSQITAATNEGMNWGSHNPIHALHLIALARSKYGLLPRKAEHPIIERSSDYAREAMANQNGLRGLAKNPYVLLNLRSLAKLKPEASRKSYFLRSVNITTCTRIIKYLISSGAHVIDVTEYPRSQEINYRLSCESMYLHLDCMKLEFHDYALLIKNASQIITIDSMLTHLAAAVGQTHTLLLPKGHDQRWIKNLSSSDCMYASCCQTYKQSNLHNWDTLEKYGFF